MESKIVVVSGAGSGIGLSLTGSLVEMGYRVAALDLDVSSLTELAAQHPSNLRCHTVDVRSPAQVQRAISSVLAEWGKVDILVNNSAVPVFGSFEDKKVDQIRREFELNYFGYLHLIRAVLPSMKAHGFGIIHNVSSGVALTGLPGLTGYTSTKGAMESLSRSLRQELERHGIAVTLMRTPLVRTRPAGRSGIPLPAMADPVDVGRRLAQRILSTRAVISTGGVLGTLRLSAMRFFADMMGSAGPSLTQRPHPRLAAWGRMAGNRRPAWNP